MAVPACASLKIPGVRRRLFNIVGGGTAAVSLALCLSFIAMGLRSLAQEDTWDYLARDGRLIMLISKAGRLDVLHISQWIGDEPGLSHRTQPASVIGGTDYSHRFLGFGAGVQLNGGRFVNIPYWALSALAALLPGWWLWRRLRRRTRAGCCTQCGYDLRATPEQGGALLARCPECGTQVARVSKP